MPSDELGSIWNSDPVRVTQSIKRAGKELDREEQKRRDHQEEQERESDTVELSSDVETEAAAKIKLRNHNLATKPDIPGSQIDLTVE